MCIRDSIKTADQLNLPTPEVEYHNIVAQPTEHQQEMVKTCLLYTSIQNNAQARPDRRHRFPQQHLDAIRTR